MNPAAPVTNSFMDLLGRGGAHLPVRPAPGGDRVAPRVGLVAGRQDRIGDPPVGGDGGVVPHQPELVGRVVVAVDEVGDDHVGDRGEAVGDTGRDEHAAVVVAG